MAAVAPLFQRALFCACGRDLPAGAGLCRACYQQRWRSERYFGGNRERILARDRGQCTVCGDQKGLCVHHRRPGLQSTRWLTTVCRGCHARLHRRHRLPGFAPPALVLLWKEQHPGWPLQLQLPWADQELARAA
jgi:hypothetical protein